MPVAENYSKWYSPNLDQETQMMSFGEGGVPLILFPTSMGGYNQNIDFGLVGAIYPFIAAGKVKVYCVDGIDKQSFYAYDIHPAHRIHNHICYDRMILEEVLGRAYDETGHTRVMVGGCSFGGYHAVNFGFRHPDRVREIISMGGAFDIKQFFYGYYSDDVYFNNPVDYMSNMHDPELLKQFHRMGIILGTGHEDICRQDNHRLADILGRKGIPHWCDDRPGTGHDWPWWRVMLFEYLDLIVRRMDG
ncbi:MAG: esterase family protein [Fimbriimonadaceae bacterium]|nr:esterase family protein [Fimbriimonadaceae bacterium]